MNKFVHVELHTSDVAAAKKFYKSLFDWKTQDLPMEGMTYTMFDTGSKEAGGGMMVKPSPEAPTQWLPYVAVASVKRTIGKAKKAGAQVIVEYQPIPDMGAFGIFLDPAGAALGVFEAKMPKKAKRKAKKR